MKQQGNQYLRKEYFNVKQDDEISEEIKTTDDKLKTQLR